MPLRKFPPLDFGYTLHVDDEGEPFVRFYYPGGQTELRGYEQAAFVDMMYTFLIELDELSERPLAFAEEWNEEEWQEFWKSWPSRDS